MNILKGGFEVVDGTGIRKGRKGNYVFNAPIGLYNRAAQCFRTGNYEDNFKALET